MFHQRSDANPMVEHVNPTFQILYFYFIIKKIYTKYILDEALLVIIKDNFDWYHPSSSNSSRFLSS